MNQNIEKCQNNFHLKQPKHNQRKFQSIVSSKEITLECRPIDRRKSTFCYAAT